MSLKPMGIFSKKKELSLGFIAFLQAVGLVVYCGLVGYFLWQGEKWVFLGRTTMGPILVLLIFSASALICALIVGVYPFFLFWEKKQTNKALKIVIYTAVWLAFLIVLFFFSLWLVH